MIVTDDYDIKLRVDLLSVSLSTLSFNSKSRLLVMVSLKVTLVARFSVKLHYCCFNLHLNTGTVI